MRIRRISSHEEVWLGGMKAIPDMNLSEVQAVLSKCLERKDVLSFTWHAAKKRFLELCGKEKT